MLAVDTNVVIRIMMDDDPVQNGRALQIFDRETIFLAKSVVLETEWVLRSLYRLHPARFAGAVEAMISLENVRCEDETAVRQALAWHQAGMDFADALHLASSTRATQFVTFDQDMIKAAKRLDLPVSAP
jgi:predicted nucleic-acid-binding protein